MDMTGDRILPVPRQAVWDALNDPATLQACIPGCRSLEPSGDNGFRATAAVKIGPISAQFAGEVRLLDLVPPVSYRIEGSGLGGAAGFARGGATVILTEEASETRLAYTVHAEVGGKLAQLGARLIDATAKQMSGQFFDRLALEVATRQAAAAPTHPAAPSQAQPAAAPASFDFLRAQPKELLGYPAIAWAAALIFLFIAFNLFAH